MDAMFLPPVLFIVLYVAFVMTLGYYLRSRGMVFLTHVFPANEALVSATNFLLNIGYYLLSLGILLLNIAISFRAQSFVGSLQEVCARLGIAIVVLGVLHSVNVIVLALLIPRSKNSSNST